MLLVSYLILKMSIIPMTKIRLVFHENDKKNIVASLQNIGLVEFTSLPENEILKKKPLISFKENYKASTLDFAVNFLSKWQDKNIIKSAIEGSREEIQNIKIKEIARTFNYEEIIARVIALEEELNHLQARILDLESKLSLLKNWVKYPLNLNTTLITSKTETRLLKTNIKTKEEIISELNKKEIIYYLEEYDQQNISLTFLKKDSNYIEKTIKQLEIEEVDLPYRLGTVKETILKMNQEIEADETEREKTISTIKKLTIYLPTLKILADWYYWRKKRNEFLNSTIGTEKTTILEGWCPTNEIPKLKRSISKITDKFIIRRIKNPSDNPPVEIKNRALFKPFESITRLYGLPNYKDLDPTAFLAGFFFIFFGFCLTDVFYGLFLAGVILLLFKIYKIPKNITPLLWLIFLGGVSSSLIGIFFGGYLGFSTENMPKIISNLQLFDPIKNPLPIFYLSLILGIIQIISGLVIKIISDAKNGHLMDGLLDQGPWLFTFFALGLYVNEIFNFVNILPKGIAVYTLLAGVIMIILTQGRKEENILKKLFMGVLSLYNSVGYFSDMLSYSRLLALGLSTSALAFSVNMIAFMVKDMVPVIGWLLFIMVLLVGHLFNLAVNVLGAFVHSARLQFVEFFGKFITGTGRSFRPFAREERNIIIVR